MTINKLLDDIIKYEKIVRKKYPGQKGRVLLANVRSDIDYEIGKPENTISTLKWNTEYLIRIKKI
jgi:hypothetical protein